MAEDDRVELFSQNEQIVSQTHIQTSDKPSPHILRGSGSGSGSGGGGGGGEGNALLQEQQSHQNLFIQEDEMASWLHHPHFYSDLLYYSVLSTHPQSSVSQTQERPPLPIVTAPYDLTPERPPGQVLTARRTENFMNFSRLRANIFTSGKAESAGPWIPVVRESTKVGSSATPSSSSATESCLTLATHGTESRATAIGGVSQTFAVPGLGHKEKVVAIDKGHEIAGPSSSGVSKAETEPSQMQPATETADNKKRKDREETIEETEETKEAPDSLSRKRSRAAEMHNISERKRREKINEKMKALQELIPRCNKTDKASMLDDAIEYVKSLQMQIQMMSMGGGGMMPMMYSTNMQRFMPDMTTMGMMGMNQPPLTPFRGSAFPRSTHTSSSNPAPRYPFPDNQAFDPSRVHVSSQQPEPVSNQPQFPGYFNPYSQFVGLHQMQQPPPSQNQTSQLSFSQASSSKESEDQENKPTG